MDEAGFRQHLKRSVKKDHVADGLVSQVQAFELYLASERRKRLDAAEEQDIRDYVGTLAPSAVKERMRGLVLYYGFVGCERLARLAGEIREQRIAKTRKAFRLSEFVGVNGEDIARLEAAGIVTVAEMLEAGRSSRDRRLLAERTGVSPQAILELVKLSDLSRLAGVKSVRARLYYDAGLETPEAFVGRDPEALRRMLVQFVERTGFDGIAPLPKEIRNTVATAGTLPRAVEYDE